MVLVSGLLGGGGQERSNGPRPRPLGAASVAAIVTEGLSLALSFFSASFCSTFLSVLCRAVRSFCLHAVHTGACR